MVYFILFVALVNLALGYLAAILLRAAGDLRGREEPPPTNAETAGQVIDEATPQTSKIFAWEAVTAHQVDLPAAWHELIEEGIQTRSFVEAATHVLRLQIGRYRDRLIHLDHQARRLARGGQESLLVPLIDEIKTVNSQWLDCQAQAACHLHDRQGTLGALSDVGSDLEHVLEEQTAQIETTCSNLGRMQLESAPQDGQRLVQEVGRLIDLSHALRDKMQESLTAIVRTEQRLESLDEQLRIDGLTGLVNRCGFESLIQQWWRDDPDRRRPLSVALVDVDRFKGVNARYGPLIGDHVLQALADFVGGLVRHDRGHDLVGRYSGGRLAILYGDATTQQAVNAIERVRQSLAASEFDAGGESLQLTVSCGVTTALATDDGPTLLSRLEQALAQARRSGRNCTIVDHGDGQGPESVSPPDFDIQGKLIHVDVRGDEALRDEVTADQQVSSADAIAAPVAAVGD